MTAPTRATRREVPKPGEIDSEDQPDDHAPDVPGPGREGKMPARRLDCRFSFCHLGTVEARPVRPLRA